MASACSPSGVSRMKSASVTCIVHFRIQAPAIKNRVRVELGAQAPMDGVERRSQGREHRVRALTAAKQRGVAAQRVCTRANMRGRASRAYPAQRTAPFDQLFLSKLYRHGAWGQGQSPQRRIAAKERLAVFA